MTADKKQTKMEYSGYIKERILEFESRIATIEECRNTEMVKPFNKRNYQVLYILHKDEILYKFCIQELKTIIDKF